MDNRLLKIAELVGSKVKIIDVGTDHGYLPVYLVEKAQVEYAIVSDVSKGSLAKAKDLISQKQLNHKIDSRLGSGFKTITKNDDVSLAIIAGMGGHLISKLIEEDKKFIFDTKIDLVLQPMQNTEALRGYLMSNGFEIVDEKLVAESNRIYQIIKAKVGVSAVEYDNIDLEYGHPSHYYSEEQSDLYRRLLENKLKEINSIINKINHSKIDMAEELNKENNFLKNLIQQKLGEQNGAL